MGVMRVMRVVPIGMSITISGNNTDSNSTNPDDQFYSYSKVIDESINNEGNSTKRVVMGKEETNDNGNKTSNVIHKADDMNGHDLSLDDE